MSEEFDDGLVTVNEALNHLLHGGVLGFGKHFLIVRTMRKVALIRLDNRAFR